MAGLTRISHHNILVARQMMAQILVSTYEPQRFDRGDRADVVESGDYRASGTSGLWLGPEEYGTAAMVKSNLLSAGRGGPRCLGREPQGPFLLVLIRVDLLATEGAFPSLNQHAVALHRYHFGSIEQR